MKKSLIALAVLGSVAGVAQAQSTVTLYGIVDAYLGSSKTGIGASSVTSLSSGGLSGSRFGLKGEEDLGGGLKAVFKLEQGFRADTGLQSAPGTAFGRQAYVGLAGGFGEVTVGNTWTAMDDILGAGNPVFDSVLSPGNNVLVVNSVYSSNPGNTIRYATPSFGGFGAVVTHSLKEVAAVTGHEGITDFALMYGAGPVAANLSYQVQKNPGAIGADLKLTHLNGSYDFGVAKLIASVGQAKLDAEKATDYQIGADFPLSSALTLSAGVARSTDNLAAGDGKRTGYSFGATYALSKRTTTYAGFRKSTEKDAAGVKIDEDRLLAVGIRHTF